MSTESAVTVLPATQPPSLVARFAARYSVDPKKLLTTLKNTAFKQPKDRQTGQVVDATDEEMMALLIVADRYGLDPFTRQIYAFRDFKRGGIVPIVGVDGWIQIVNDHPQYNGATFETGLSADGKLEYIECTMFRKDREHPTKIREYLRENKRDTEAWTGMANRMLRHRAFIQCGRIAFGLTGIYDQDEAERIIEGTATTVPAAPPEAAPVIETLNAKIAKRKPEPVVDLAGDMVYTYAEVRDRLERAKGDDFALAVDMIRSVADEAQRAELTELAKLLEDVPQ